MAETTDIRVETLLRQTLSEEAATVPVRVTPADVLARRRRRRIVDRTRSLRLLLVAALLALPAAALVMTAARPEGDPRSLPGEALTLTTPRAAHTATGLADGRVLLTGAWTGDGRATAELYDPGTGSFEATGQMARPRSFGTATRLSDGRVLIVGGDEGGSTAELYDPELGTFERTGEMVVARGGHASVLLPDGRVVLIGGLADDAVDPTDLVEVYDPVSGGFEGLGIADPGLDLVFPMAVALDDGRVLVVGGRERGSSWRHGGSLVLDPASGSVQHLEPISIGRYPALGFADPRAAVRLHDGRVLVVATPRERDGRSSLVTFDPDTGEFEAVAEVEGAFRVYPVEPPPALLPDGRVLIMLGAPCTSIHGPVGCDEGAPDPPAPPLMDPVYVFDPVSGEAALVTSVPGRDRATLTVLHDGGVLIAGGEVQPDEASAEAWRFSVPRAGRDEDA